MTRAVHQFVPVLEPGAVGNHTLAIQQVLRGAGFRSEIFAMRIDDRWAGRARDLADYGTAIPMDVSDVLIYQYAIGSELADRVLQFPGTLVVNSHTQTPPELLGRWQPDATFGVAWGAQQLVELGKASRLGIAVSGFNAEEMRQAGFGEVVVVPVLTKLADVEPDSKVIADRPDVGARWLFVGRIAPNKMQHRLVQALAWYRRAYDSDAQLVLVGSGIEGRYGRALRRYIDELALTEAVILTGPISTSELSGFYRSADVFVCLSEHEGFCVPLLEAMRAGLPIVAKATSAIPETLGDAGLLLQTARSSEVSAAVHRVISDVELRKSLIDCGIARAAAFATDAIAAEFLRAMKSVLV